jgi:hypothetical protein
VVGRQGRAQGRFVHALLHRHLAGLPQDLQPLLGQFVGHQDAERHGGQHGGAAAVREARSR